VTGRLFLLCVSLFTCGVLGGGVVSAQPQNTPKEQGGSGITQQQADDILKELRGIRQALERLAQPPPPAGPPVDERVRLTDVTGYSLGRPDAPVTIVEFTDLQCPFCQRFNLTTFDQLKKQYIDTGQVRFITRDFPLDSIHPMAMRSALASRCAGDQGKFWEMHLALVRDANKLTPEFIDETAVRFGIAMPAFQECVDQQRHLADIKKDQEAGERAGISGTPSFVVGPTAGDTLDGVRIVGAQPLAAFEARIKEAQAPPKKP